jgi:hypothetical protein
MEIKNDKLDYENRIMLYDTLRNKLQDDKDCLDDLKCTLLNTGGFSSNWIKQITINNVKFSYALKIQCVKPYVIKNKYDTNLNVWREYDILKKCTKLVIDKISCNLPIIYDLKVCEVENKIIIYNELANGSFTDWILMEHTEDEWLSFLFQLWVSLYSLQKHLKLVHNDLRFGNVLYHVTNNVTNKYTINNKSYYMANNGYTFVIWDYGGAKIDDGNDKITKQKLAYSTDLHFFHDTYNRIRVLILLNKYTAEELGKFFVTLEDLKYVKEAQNECEIRFRKSGRYEEKCKIALIYYLIENNRFEELYKAKKDNLSETNVVKMPPAKIMKLLKELSENYNYNYTDIIQFNKNMKKVIPSVDFLIEKYFSKYMTETKYHMEFVA